MPQHCPTGGLRAVLRHLCTCRSLAKDCHKVTPQDSSSPVCGFVDKPVSGAISLLSIRSKGILKGSGMQQWLEVTQGAWVEHWHCHYSPPCMALFSECPHAHKSWCTEGVQWFFNWMDEDFSVCDILHYSSVLSWKCLFHWLLRYHSNHYFSFCSILLCLSSKLIIPCLFRALVFPWVMSSALFLVHFLWGLLPILRVSL